jgi:hypothetical protein
LQRWSRVTLAHVSYHFIHQLHQRVSMMLFSDLKCFRIRVNLLFFRIRTFGELIFFFFF